MPTRFITILRLVVLTSLLSACGGPSSETSEALGDDGVATSAEPIFGGLVQDPGEAGAIELGFGSGSGFDERCTGVLIGPFHALTAAHCTDQGNTRVADGSMNRTVNYFHPVNGLTQISGTNAFLWVSVVGNWGGLSDASKLDYVHDLAIVYNPEGWWGTTTSDYRDIYTGKMGDVGLIYLYGAGVSSNTDLSSRGVLRVDGIAVSNYDSLSFYGTGHSTRTCAGDSGGPYITSSRSFGGFIGVMGIHVAGEGSPVNGCTKNGGREWAVRPGSYIDFIAGWLNSDVGQSCNRSLAGGRVARCF